jgi:hypothetical protein
LARSSSTSAASTIRAREAESRGKERVVKPLKTILGMLILLVGGVLLVLTMPAYYANFKLDSMISDQAIYFTNYPKPADEIAATVAQKADDDGVALTPDQVTVAYDRGNLTIGVHYSVHINFPPYPFDLKFDNSTTNQNVMD